MHSMMLLHPCTSLQVPPPTSSDWHFNEQIKILTYNDHQELCLSCVVS